VRATRHAFLVTGAAVLTLTLAAALSGCHGTSSADPMTQAETPNPRTAPTSPPVAQATSPTTPQPKNGRCATADLRVVPAQHEVKQGLNIERFAVTTTAAAGCTLSGAPNLVPKGPLSAQETNATVDLAVSQQRVPDDVDLHAGDGATVALRPGKTASFYLAWYSTSTVVCVQSSGFGFNAPGDKAYTDMQSVAYAIGSLCDGIFYVSPMF
jgi:hypothetical protein